VSINTPGVELAQIEFRRLSSVAWLSIALLYSAQALTSQFPINPWQLYYVAGIIVAAFISISLQTLAAYEASYAPLVLYLLLAPVILGTTPEKPWMSYGVLTVFANIYVATIFRRFYAIFVMSIITIFQIWVVRQDLTSISDLADMRLLNTYFSSLWTIGTGIAFILIRQRYLEASEKIEDEIVRLKQRISTRFQAISLQNRDDYRNLKLHGTILNTLIFAKNNLDFLSKRQQFSETIKKELNDLRLDQRGLKSDLAATLNELLQRRTLNRIRVANIEVSGRISDASLENNILEIVREILLNLEKHTTVAEVHIELQIEVNGNIVLRISESAHYEISSLNLESRKMDALRSESVKRLLAITPSQLAITTTPDGFGLVYTVTNLEATDRAGDPREIYRLRKSNAIDFAENIARAIAIYGLLFLPGYFLLGIDVNLIILLTAHAFVVAFSILKKSNSKNWLSLSTLLSLTLPMVISQDVQACTNISYLPWVLNIVMMNTFIFATEIRNNYLRWFPLLIITIELLILPRTYPSQCQDIFLGSLPAVPLIIIFTLVLGSLLKRLYKQDAEQISSTFVDEANVRLYEDALEFEYKRVITDLEDFNQELMTIGDEAISVRIENEIQKIRAFLVCSEQFESKIIRELYRFVIERLRAGVATRLNILGEFIYQLDQSAPIDELLTQLSPILEGVPCEISLVKLDELIFEIHIGDKYFQAISDQLSSLTTTNFEVRLNRL
jgi:hypothetical protein